MGVIADMINKLFPDQREARMEHEECKRRWAVARQQGREPITHSWKAHLSTSAWDQRHRRGGQ